MSSCHISGCMAYLQTNGLFDEGICVQSDGDWEQPAQVPDARGVLEPYLKWQRPELHAWGGVAHVALQIQPRVQPEQYQNLDTCDH